MAWCYLPVCSHGFFESEGNECAACANRDRPPVSIPADAMPAAEYFRDDEEPTHDESKDAPRN